MPRGVKISVDKIKTLIVKHDGNISEVARRLKTSRQAIYNIIKREPELKILIDDARESFVDLAESKLKELVNESNITAIIFALKTQGRSRGYIERLQLNISHEVQAVLPKLLTELEKADIDASELFNSLLAELHQENVDSE